MCHNDRMPPPTPGPAEPAAASDLVDQLIDCDWVVPVTPEREVLHDHSVALSGARIHAVLPSDRARALYPDANVVRLAGHALIPGLINMHQHAAMTLLRGLGDDLPLKRWLDEVVWPTEQAHVSAGFVRDGAGLAIYEMLRAGSCGFSDMYFFPEVTAELARACGCRAQLMFPIIELPSAWAKDEADYLNKGIALYDAWRDESMVDVGFGPHATYSVSDGMLDQIAMLRNELEEPSVQIHLHENESEVANALASTGRRPLQTLHEHGLTGPHLHCVHMVACDESDMDLLAETGSHVIHCPRSNLKLASGIAPLSQWLERGINVALGTDGAASNNSLDMLGEMRCAALLAKAHSGRADAVSAHQVLEMATINAARALNAATERGSIEAGKLADLTAVDLRAAEAQPVHDPLSAMLYTAGARCAWLWIDGHAVCRDGTVTTMDAEAVLNAAAAWRERLQA